MRSTSETKTPGLRCGTGLGIRHGGGELEVEITIKVNTTTSPTGQTIASYVAFSIYILNFVCTPQLMLFYMIFSVYVIYTSVKKFSIRRDGLDKMTPLRVLKSEYISNTTLSITLHYFIYHSITEGYLGGTLNEG